MQKAEVVAVKGSRMADIANFRRRKALSKGAHPQSGTSVATDGDRSGGAEGGQ
jgi:hypothetical protein